MTELRTIGDIRNVLHSRLLATRSLQRLVEAPDFLEAYEKASEVQKDVSRQLIRHGDREGLEKWVRIQQKIGLQLETLTMRELRKLAQGMGISGYNYLPKASLLSEIANKEML